MNQSGTKDKLTTTTGADPGERAGAEATRAPIDPLFHHEASGGSAPASSGSSRAPSNSPSNTSHIVAMSYPTEDSVGTAARSTLKSPGSGRFASFPSGGAPPPLPHVPPHNPALACLYPVLLAQQPYAFYPPGYMPYAPPLWAHTQMPAQMPPTPYALWPAGGAPHAQQLIPTLPVQQHRRRKPATKRKTKEPTDPLTSTKKRRKTGRMLAWNLFFKSRFPIVRTRSRKSRNEQSVPFRDIAKQIGIEWHRLSDAEKDKYMKEALEEEDV